MLADQGFNCDCGACCFGCGHEEGCSSLVAAPAVDVAELVANPRPGTFLAAFLAGELLAGMPPVQDAKADAELEAARLLLPLDDPDRHALDTFVDAQFAALAARSAVTA